jgi:hypothetical protein
MVIYIRKIVNTDLNQKHSYNLQKDVWKNSIMDIFKYQI